MIPRQTGNVELKITYPCIIIKWINISIGNGLIDPREDSLRSDHSPCCSPLRRRLELAVEPIFLATTHHRAACVVGDLVDVMCIPVQIGDGSIVVTSIKHYKVKQCTDRKASPNSQIVIHFNLANWHPLKVSSNSVHLSLVDTDSAIPNK